MNSAAIEQSFREKVCAKVRIAPEGEERFRVFTPFQLDDGDHLAIVLKRREDSWVLSDEGHTFMHLSYDIDEKDLRRGTRQTIIDNALSGFRVEDRDGELVARVAEDRFGDALYSFVQALLKVSDVTFLTRERVRSTFLDDVRELIGDVVPETRRIFDWHEATRDPQASYTVDCRVNGIRRPLMVFALPNDGRVRDATITLLTFEKWSLPHQSLGIFEDQEQVNRKVLARFTDICERQYSSLTGNRDRIARHLRETLEAA